LPEYYIVNSDRLFGLLWRGDPPGRNLALEDLGFLFVLSAALALSFRVLRLTMGGILS
jgi:hypothetical protein